MKKLMTPSLIDKGATIGIVAPSEPITKIDRDNIIVGVNNLREMGFNVVFADHVNISLDSPESAIVRAKDIMEMYKRDDIDMIMAAIGGYSSLEMVEYLDYAVISKYNKPFIGFSDITVLNNALYKFANKVTYYGPTFAIFCQKIVPVFTKEYFLQVVSSNRPITVKASEAYADDLWYENNDGQRIWKDNPGWKIINSEKFEGQIVGGNLETLLALAGTEYFPTVSNRVLIIEEAQAKSNSVVRRELQQLKMLGVFSKISAVMFGRFWGWNQERQALFFDNLCKSIMSDFKKPIIYNLDFGHTDPMMTIPIGGYVKYDETELVIRK